MMFDEMKYERNRVVAHYRNGSLLKGYTHDFSPQKEKCTLLSAHDKDNIAEIRVPDLKALFFVKTFEGKKNYTEKKTFDDFDAFGLRGLKVKAVFFDGEIIRGMSYDYSTHFNGFHIVPVDSKSNNEKIYIVADSLIYIAVGSAADN